MACGAAAIATDLPTTREWIVNEVNGMLVHERSRSVGKGIIKILKHRFLKINL